MIQAKLSFRDRFAIKIALFGQFLIKLFRMGSGSTWPGELALKISPQILKHLSQEAPIQVLVVGTNGKTTTSKMLETILKKAGRSSRRNSSGANLENGIIFSIISDLKRGNFQSQVQIFEVDEAALVKVLPKMKPKVIILMNLFRDQLDRYGEVEAIAEKWAESFKFLPKDCTMIYNGDDPQIAFLGQNFPGQKKSFALESPGDFSSSKIQVTDSTYCPKCNARLNYEGVYFSHLGIWHCDSCGFKQDPANVSEKNVKSPLLGLYNVYNSLAAKLSAELLNISAEEIQAALNEFKPAFGRMEEIEIETKKIRIVLSKNPTGLNESLRAVLSKSEPEPILFVLNDQIPDGRDVSWIWDADFEQLKGHPFVMSSGSRALDMGLRLKYALGREPKIEIELKTALKVFLEQIKPGQSGTIIPNYSAMLEVRQELLGRKIL